MIAADSSDEGDGGKFQTIMRQEEESENLRQPFSPDHGTPDNQVMSPEDMLSSARENEPGDGSSRSR